MGEHLAGQKDASRAALKAPTRADGTVGCLACQLVVPTVLQTAVQKVGKTAGQMVLRLAGSKVFPKAERRAGPKDGPTADLTGAEMAAQMAWYSVAMRGVSLVARKACLKAGSRVGLWAWSSAAATAVHWALPRVVRSVCW